MGHTRTGPAGGADYRAEWPCVAEFWWARSHPDLPSEVVRWQHEEVIETMIEQFRSDINGQLSDKRRVTDHLLDIRLEATDRPSLVAETDRLLAEMPGLTTVENEWWRAALDDLDEALSAVPIG